MPKKRYVVLYDEHVGPVVLSRNCAHVSIVAILLVCSKWFQVVDTIFPSCVLGHSRANCLMLRLHAKMQKLNQSSIVARKKSREMGQSGGLQNRVHASKLGLVSEDQEHIPVCNK